MHNSAPRNRFAFPRRILLISAASLVVAMTSSGCNSSSLLTDSPTAASEAMTRGLKAVDEKSWETADSELTTAIESQALSREAYEEALAARTQVRLESDDLDGAEEDLSFLENSDSPSKPDRILVLKASLKLKQGDKPEAKKLFLLAKKINKDVKAPVGL